MSAAMDRQRIKMDELHRRVVTLRPERAAERDRVRNYAAFEYASWVVRAPVQAQGVALPAAAKVGGLSMTTMLQFLTDVTTAAGLLSHGKTDKVLARRIGSDAYAMRAATPVSAPASADDARDAARWRQAIRYVGADRSPALGISYFVLRGVPTMPGVDLMLGSVAQHFAEAIDQARYQADMDVIDSQRAKRRQAVMASGTAPAGAGSTP